MSDEAFARRFYSDRAELVGLGVPLDSQRDEFTGEELYTLRSERYFLPPLDLDDDELAALQTCLYLLEGRFAYAEPLRLALQNLALGRSAGVLERAPTATAVRVEVRDPDYTPELQGRLGKLEAAISKQRTVRFRYWSIAPRRRARADDQPLRAAARERHLVRDRPGPGGQRRQELPRLAHPLGDPLRDTPRARLPRSRRPSTSRSSAAAPSGSSATSPARRGSSVAPDTAWWVEREYAGPRNRVEGDVFVTEYASLPLLARWILRQDGRAVPLEPSPLRRLVTEGVRAARQRARGRAARAGRRAARRPGTTAPPTGRPARSRRSASACSSRCSPTCSPPAARSARP